MDLNLGLEQQIAALQADFGQLWTEFGEVRRSNDNMAQALELMRTSFDSFTTALQDLRGPFHNFYPGSLSSRLWPDEGHNQRTSFFFYFSMFEY